jgi:hypothetical protein
MTATLFHFLPPAAGAILGGLLLLTVLRSRALAHLKRAFSDPLPAEFPYRARKYLLSDAELAFYRVLAPTVRDDFTVACKVRLADVIDCPASVWSLGYGRLIAQKHLDFVLCDPHNSRIALAIELDDRSHRRPSRRARDEFVDRALRAAGVPLVRVRAASAYRPAAVRAVLGKAQQRRHGL